MGFFSTLAKLEMAKNSISNVKNLKDALANQREFKWQRFPVADDKKNDTLCILQFQFLP